MSGINPDEITVVAKFNDDFQRAVLGDDDVYQFILDQGTGDERDLIMSWGIPGGKLSPDDPRYVEDNLWAAGEYVDMIERLDLQSQFVNTIPSVEGVEPILLNSRQFGNDLATSIGSKNDGPVAWIKGVVSRALG